MISVKNFLKQKNEHVTFSLSMLLLNILCTYEEAECDGAMFMFLKKPILLSHE